MLSSQLKGGLLNLKSASAHLKPVCLRKDVNNARFVTSVLYTPTITWTDELQVFGYPWLGKVFRTTKAEDLLNHRAKKGRYSIRSLEC